jgi:cytochrome c biogenesis protein ResB
MTYFLIGAILGLIIGAILGSYVAKIGNITDQVTNITGGKQIIKDSPGAMLSTELNKVDQLIKKKRIFGRIFNNLKNRRNEKL